MKQKWKMLGTAISLGADGALVHADTACERCRERMNIYGLSCADGCPGEREVMSWGDTLKGIRL